jgi:hypothetical protein
MIKRLHWPIVLSLLLDGISGSFPSYMVFARMRSEKQVDCEPHPLPPETVSKILQAIPASVGNHTSFSPAQIQDSWLIRRRCDEVREYIVKIKPLKKSRDALFK